MTNVQVTWYRGSQEQYQEDPLELYRNRISQVVNISLLILILILILGQPLTFVPRRWSETADLKWREVYISCCRKR